MKDQQEITDKINTAKELVSFFWNSSWWWLTPYICILLLIGIIVATHSAKEHSRFIYTLS